MTLDILGNRSIFQNKDFNVDEVLGQIAVIPNFEEKIENYLFQIQKDIVTVLDTNYNKLQDLGHKIQVGLKVSDVIEEEIDFISKMTKSSSLIADVDPDSPEGRLLKIRSQKQMLITEHYLKLDFDYLKVNKPKMPVDINDIDSLELLEYYLLIINRCKEFIEASSEERQQLFVKQFEPFRLFMANDCTMLIDILKQFKIQQALDSGFSDGVVLLFNCLKLSLQWESAMPTIASKLISDPMQDLYKTLGASINSSNLDMKYSIIENYLKGMPLLIAKLSHSFTSIEEKSLLILDNIFQNAVKYMTDQRWMANTHQEYSKDYQKAIQFLTFFTSNFIEPFQLNTAFRNHPGLIIFKRKYNPVPFANVQKSEIVKILAIPFDSKKLLSKSAFHFEYFEGLKECLSKISTLQSMPHTAEITCQLLFLVLDTLKSTSKQYNELPLQVIHAVFSDFCVILTMIHKTTTDYNNEYKNEFLVLIKHRYTTLQSLINKLGQYALEYEVEIKLKQLQQIRNIPSVVRMGGKEIDGTPSTYINDVVVSANLIFLHFEKINSELKLVISSVECLANSYLVDYIAKYIISIASEVLNTIKKTEESLKRFKKSTNESSISDEDKMRAQIYIDCCFLFSKVFFFLI